MYDPGMAINVQAIESEKPKSQTSIHQTYNRVCADLTTAGSLGALN
jgi:hypothetical protein